MVCSTNVNNFTFAVLTSTGLFLLNFLPLSASTLKRARTLNVYANQIKFCSLKIIIQKILNRLKKTLKNNYKNEI